jgi:hypothetical protein
MRFASARLSLGGFDMKDISSDYKWAIGDLVVETAKLESAVTNLVAVATGMGPVAALIFVHHQQHSSKISSLLAYFDFYMKDDPRRQSVMDKFNRVKEVADFRNTVVHSYWTVDDAGAAYVTKWQARAKLTYSKRPIPVEEIRQHMLEARDLRGSLEALARLYAEFAKSNPEDEPLHSPEGE